MTFGGFFFEFIRIRRRWRGYASDLDSSVNFLLMRWSELKVLKLVSRDPERFEIISIPLRYELSNKNLFVSQCLFFSQRLSYYFTRDKVETYSLSSPHHRFSISGSEKNLCYEVVSVHLDWGDIFRLRVLSKFAYNIAVREFNNKKIRDFDNHRDEINLNLHWTKLGIMMSRGSDCSHNCSYCLFCAYDNYSIFDGVFRRRIVAKLREEYGIRIVDRREESFLSFCDRIYRMMLKSSSRKDDIFIFFRKCSEINCAVSYLSCDRRSIELITCVWLIGAQDRLRDEKFLNHMEKFVDLHPSNHNYSRAMLA